MNPLDAVTASQKTLEAFTVPEETDVQEIGPKLPVFDVLKTPFTVRSWTVVLPLPFTKKGLPVPLKTPNPPPLVAVTCPLE